MERSPVGSALPEQLERWHALALELTTLSIGLKPVRKDIRVPR